MTKEDKAKEMTIEQAIKALRFAASALTATINASVDGIENALKQGIISPSDSLADAQKKMIEFAKKQA